MLSSPRRPSITILPFFFSRISLPGRAPDVFDHLVGGVFRCGWLLRYLDLLIDKMNLKSSLIQILKSVQQALTSDTCR
jgi:hypothetical protein|tara:strand:- start:59 stop:292 length:234 start_codon:yes stop_codon:yes gene_type:complete